MSSKLIEAVTADQSIPTLAREASVASYLRRNWFLVLAAVVGWLGLFWPTLVGLVEYWLEDPDYSHGFLVPVIAAGILYANRQAVGVLRPERSLVGLSVLLGSCGLLFLGVLSHTNVLERAAAWGSLVGGIWFLLGFRVLARAPFPYLYLLLAIPLPYNLLQPFRLALKAIATRITADLLRDLGGYAAHPEGNVLVVGEHLLEVADACSGIRSLMAIVSTAILFAYLFRTGWIKGTLLVATAVPVAVLVNVLRILIVSVALVSHSIDMTHGVEHETIGFLVFGLSLGLLFACMRFYDWLLRWKPREGKA